MLGRWSRGICTICGGPSPRTCAAWAIDRLVVSKLLNHAEGGVTKIYDRYTADPEQAAAVRAMGKPLARDHQRRAGHERGATGIQ